MQSAEAVVEVLRARGRRGLPCERLYRQLFNAELFLMACTTVRVCYMAFSFLPPAGYGGWAAALSRAW